MSVGDLLDDWFECDAFKGAMASSGVVGVWAGPRTPGTAYNLLHHELGEIEGVKGLWGHVKGGMGAISMAIARSAEASGATSAPARPCGRSTSSRRPHRRRHAGDRRGDLRARSSCPARTRRRPCSTWSAPSTSPTTSPRTCASYRTRGGSVKVNWVLSEPPRYEGVSAEDQNRLVRSGVAFCPSIDMLERAWQDACRGVPAETPYLEVETPVDDRLDAHRRRHDDRHDVHPVRPVGGVRLAGGLARGVRRPLPGDPRRARAEREGRRDPPRGAGAAGPRAHLRPRRRLDLPGRAGPRPDGVHAADRRRWRSTRPRSTACTCAARARTRAAASWRSAATTRRTASCTTSASSAPAGGCGRRCRYDAVAAARVVPAPRVRRGRARSRWRRRPSGRAGGCRPRTSRGSGPRRWRAGLAGGLHAREHGGQGWTKTEWVLVEEQFGRSTNALSWHIPSAYNVLASGSPEQIDR